MVPTQGTTPDGQGPLTFGEDRAAEERKGLDLATTLERIQKNFVITDPRLPDNPIVSLAQEGRPFGRTVHPVYAFNQGAIGPLCIAKRLYCS
jgi:hypothetical protein